MPEKPILHGRDHRPGGADPIPGISSGLPWCFAENLFPASLADSTLYTIPYPEIYTSDSSIFAVTTGSGGQRTAQIVADGLYVVFADAVFNTSGAPAAGSVAQIGSVSGSSYQVGGQDISLFATAAMSTAKGAHPNIISVVNLDPGSTTPPLTLNVTVQQNSGLSITSWSSTMLIVQANAAGSSGF